MNGCEFRICLCYLSVFCADVSVQGFPGFYPDLWVNVGSSSAYLLLVSVDNLLKETKAGIDIADLGFVNLYN